MDSARNRIVWRLAAALWLAAGWSSLGRADDFHVTNRILLPGQKTLETTTLFATGRVYDFMSAPTETIVFDPGHDLIVILDPNRHLKTQISTGDVSTQIGRLREAARNHTREAVRDAAAAKFSEAVDPETGVLKLANRWMKYEVHATAPSQPQVARQYAEFADWLAQLNTLLNPPSLPFRRLALNEVLRQRQEVPLKITLTLFPEERRGKETVIRSEHTMVWALSKQDQQRIQEAHDQMHTFDEVTFDEYHRIKEEAQVAAEASLKR